MKLNKLTAAIALSMAFASGAALASPFYINVNNFDATPLGFTDGKTANIYQLGVNWTAISTYTDLDANGVDFGDTVVDSGYGTVSAYLDSAANAIGGFENNEGLNGSHGIRFEYSNLSGGAGNVVYFDSTTNPDSIWGYYNSGDIDFYSDENFDGIKNGADKLLLTASVISSSVTLGDLIVTATVKNIDPGTWFFPPSTDWTTTLLKMRLDSNLEPVADPVLIGKDQYRRVSTLDGSVSVIPEPASIALMGLGLLGLGMSRRNKKSA